MNADQLRKARSYIDWMRKNSTLSLYGYFDKDDYETRKLPDLKSENPSFAAMLVKYVNERFGGDAPKVYAAAKISRKTYSSIVSNELRPVSKQTAIQLALGLRLSRTEADAFLKAAGFAFSPAILEDIIVCACISANVFDIGDVNELLAEYGCVPFAVKEGIG